MPEEKKIDVKFVEKGDVVQVKQNHPTIELNSKDVLVQIDQMEGGITKAKDQVKQLEKNIETLGLDVVENTKRLKDLKRFEEKMLSIQESKAKALYEEIKEEMLQKVNDEYKLDDGLTMDHNLHQKYCMLQNKIATHPKVAEELAPKIIQKMYYKKTIIHNPFK